MGEEKKKLRKITCRLTFIILISFVYLTQRWISTMLRETFILWVAMSPFSTRLQLNGSIGCDDLVKNILF